MRVITDWYWLVGESISFNILLFKGGTSYTANEIGFDSRKAIFYINLMNGLHLRPACLIL